MVALGDVFSVVAVLFGVCLAIWALMVGVSMLFSAKSDRASEIIQSHPWGAFLLGAAISLVAGFISISLISLPLPGPKLAGTLVYLSVLSLAAVGSGGLALLAGERLRPLDPALSEFRAVAKGSAILVASGLLPLLGWFVFVPAMLFVSVGAGVMALLGRSPSRTGLAVNPEGV